MSYHFAEPQLLSRRALPAAAILGLHVLAAYLLATGLIQTAIHDHSPPLVATFIKDPDPLPPVPRREANIDLAADHVRFDDLPVPPLRAPEPDPQPYTEPVPTEAASAGVAAPARETLRILGRNQMPDTQEYYDPALIRGRVEGAAYVRVCVDEKGIRHTEPLLEQTSGNALLDASALNVARHGRYARAVRNGVPVPTCFRFRIAFRLR